MSQYAYIFETMAADTLRIIMLGDSYVGKSVFFNACADDDAETPPPGPTIGVELSVIHHDVEGEITRVELWDTAGQERYRAITRAYYRGGHGIILMYDITSRSSFEHLLSWWKEMQDGCPEGFRCILVANKIDLEHRRQVSFEEGRALADQFGCPFFETSALTNQGIDVALDVIINITAQQFPIGPRARVPRFPGAADGGRTAAEDTRLRTVSQSEEPGEAIPVNIASPDPLSTKKQSSCC